MSTYRLPSILYNEEGNLAGRIPTAKGVYATEGVRLFKEEGGRLWIRFPAEHAWIYGDGVVCQDMPWPGWRDVDFDPSAAVGDILRVDDEASALRFAQKYGPLWACPMHPFPCLWSGAWIPDRHGIRHWWSGYEPVDWWITAARALRLVLEAGTKLRDGDPIAPDHWEGIGLRRLADTDGTHKLSSDDLAPVHRGIIAITVNSQIAYFGPAINLTADLKLEIAAGLGFLPALWLQAAAMVAGGSGLALCSSCKTPYLRSGRAPKRGQRNYCQECGPQARKKLWSRSRR